MVRACVSEGRGGGSHGCAAAPLNTVVGVLNPTPWLVAKLAARDEVAATGCPILHPKLCYMPGGPEEGKEAAESEEEEAEAGRDSDSAEAGRDSGDEVSDGRSESSDSGCDDGVPDDIPIT